MYRLLGAAASGDVELVASLLERGLDVGVYDYDDRGVLHLAVCNLQVEVVALVVEHVLGHTVTGTPASSPPGTITPSAGGASLATLLSKRDRFGRTPEGELRSIRRTKFGKQNRAKLEEIAALLQMSPGGATSLLTKTRGGGKGIMMGGSRALKIVPEHTASSSSRTSAGGDSSDSSSDLSFLKNDLAEPLLGGGDGEKDQCLSIDMKPLVSSVSPGRRPRRRPVMGMLYPPQKNEQLVPATSDRGREAPIAFMRPRNDATTERCVFEPDDRSSPRRGRSPANNPDDRGSTRHGSPANNPDDRGSPRGSGSQI